MSVLALHLDHIFKAAFVTQCCDYSLKDRFLLPFRVLESTDLVYFSPVSSVFSYYLVDVR